MRMTEADHAEPGYERLRDASVAGVRWSLVARGVGESAQLVASVVLARLIGPAEFGHAAIALILAPLAAILTFEGFGSALVQRRHIERAHIETATLASVVSGLALTAVVLVAAPLIAAPLFGSRTSDLMQLGAPLFVIAGVGAVSRAQLWRRLDFRTLGLIETVSVAFGAGVAVVAAVAGAGGAAIVLGAIASTASSTLLFICSVRLARPRWHTRELREIVGFGGPASGAGFLYVAISNVDYTILAAKLSAGQVGLYWRAFQLGVVYQDKLSGIMMRLAFPVYARTNDLSQMRRLHRRATRVHAAAVVPLLAIFIVIAPTLIPWLFGDRWAPCVLPAQILAVAGMIAAILTGFAQVMLAAGRTKELLLFNVCLLAVYAGAALAAAPHGIVVVAIAVVGVYLLQLIAVYAVLFRRLIDIPVARMVGDLAPGLAGSIALLALGFPLAEALRAQAAPAAVIVLAVTGVGLLVHAVVLRWGFPDVWRDVTGLARRVAPARLRFRAGPAPRPLSAE
jgi:O-antigen/teichoic acid export membrane protein